MNVTRALTLLEFVSARGLDNNKELLLTYSYQILAFHNKIKIFFITYVNMETWAISHAGRTRSIS
jgi:hypothetical protein